MVHTDMVLSTGKAGIHFKQMLVGCKWSVNIELMFSNPFFWADSYVLMQFRWVQFRLYFKQSSILWWQVKVYFKVKMFQMWLMTAVFIYLSACPTLHTLTHSASVLPWSFLDLYLLPFFGQNFQFECSL